MPTDKSKNENAAPDADAYEQAPDDRGRIRLDRRLSTEEARAQDEANREAFANDRPGRFEGRVAE